MRLSLYYFAVVALAVVVASSLMSCTDAKSFGFLRRVRDARVLNMNSAKSTSTFHASRYFIQSQDHFDGSNTNTWPQQFFVNDTYWKGPSSKAPVYLCIGGEGPPLDDTVLFNSVHCSVASDWLPETGAIMFALQHRYYGCAVNMTACPVSDFKPDAKPLRFLSSRQAIGDVAQFIHFIREEYNLTSDNKIVTWGGSYPGMIAAWSRLKLPHLIHASVSSSAPVQAKFDMVEYYDIASDAYAISDDGVGGSPDCLNAIKTGHASIKQMFTTVQGRTILSSVFGQTPEWYESSDNQGNFAGMGVANFPSQDNDPSCTSAACNIAKICAIMLQPHDMHTTGIKSSILKDVSKEIQGLVAVRNAQLQWVPKELRHVVDTTMSPTAPANDLPDFWSYQTCAEFAFFQTCEVNSRCMYAQGYALIDSFTSMCKSLFNISTDTIVRNVEHSNDWYGGWTPAGSCVFWVNGSVDPWHGLSVLKSPSAGMPVLMVPGASHHAWTHPPTPLDQPSVIQARETIREQVKQFLSQDCLQANV